MERIYSFIDENDEWRCQRRAAVGDLIIRALGQRRRDGPDSIRLLSANGWRAAWQANIAIAPCW
jgi:hypothetical protein